MAKKKVLCYTEDVFGDLVVYTNGECRYKSHAATDPNSYFRWKLGCEQGIHIFYYSNKDMDKNEFRTDYNATSMDNDVEIKLANTVAKAMMDSEMDKVLRGEDE